MKEYKHKALVWRGKAGFTIIEMIIALFILVIVFFIVSYAFLTTAKTDMSLNRRSDIALSLQDAVERSVDEIRVSEDILTADTDNVAVVIHGSPVEFVYDNNTKELLRRDDSGTKTIGRNVQSLSFEYLDANGNVTATLADIRRINIEIQAQLRQELWELNTSVMLRKLAG